MYVFNGISNPFFDIEHFCRLYDFRLRSVTPEVQTSAPWVSKYHICSICSIGCVEILNALHNSLRCRTLTLKSMRTFDLYRHECGQQGQMKVICSNNKRSRHFIMIVLERFYDYLSEYPLTKCSKKASTYSCSLNSYPFEHKALQVVVKPALSTLSKQLTVWLLSQEYWPYWRNTYPVSISALVAL